MGGEGKKPQIEGTKHPLVRRLEHAIIFFESCVDRVRGHGIDCVEGDTPNPTWKFRLRHGTLQIELDGSADPCVMLEIRDAHDISREFRAWIEIVFKPDETTYTIGPSERKATTLTSSLQGGEALYREFFSGGASRLIDNSIMTRIFDAMIEVALKNPPLSKG